MEFNQNTARFAQNDCYLTPGETVRHSGIYEICHDDEERASVILMRDSIFPYCRQCGDRVRYKILELVPHISEDPDFQEVPPTDDPPYEMNGSALPLQLSRSHGFRFCNN